MALYNNPFPSSYQPISPFQYQGQQPIQPNQQMNYQQGLQSFPINQPQYQQTLQQQAPVNGTFLWVKSQKEAEDYLIAPNNSLVFMDENGQYMYMKSADQFGRPTFQIKELRDVVDTQPPQNNKSDLLEKEETANFLTQEAFENWIENVFECRLRELEQLKTQTRNGNNGKEKQNAKHQSQTTNGSF